MYFDDDEKDNLEDIENSQDDAVSWDGILDTDEDGIVSIRENSSKDESSDVPVQVFANDAEDSDDEALAGILGGADDSSDSYGGDDVDEEEIRRILNEGNASSSIDETQQEDTPVQDFSESDIDLGQAQDDILPRKDEKKEAKKGVSPVLIVLLLCIVIAGAIYYVSNMMSGGNEEVISSPQPQMPQEPQAPSEDIQQEAEQEPAIPVINEDEVSELKPDEEVKEEKKEVVNIVPTGRPNPFVPVSKYVPKVDLVTKTLNSLDFNSINIPKPPAEYGQISEVADKLMSISVSGIMYDKNKPSAIITYENNDYFVQVGDRLNNFKVVEIGPSYVKISLGKNIYRANVGEEFSIKDDFYGMVPYKNGSRQYYSSETEYSNLNSGRKAQTGVDFSIGTAVSKPQSRSPENEPGVIIKTVDKEGNVVDQYKNEQRPDGTTVRVPVEDNK